MTDARENETVPAKILKWMSHVMLRRTVCGVVNCTVWDCRREVWSSEHRIDSEDPARLASEWTERARQLAMADAAVGSPELRRKASRVVLNSGGWQDAQDAAFAALNTIQTHAEAAGFAENERPWHVATRLLCGVTPAWESTGAAILGDWGTFARAVWESTSAEVRAESQEAKQTDDDSAEALGWRAADLWFKPETLTQGGGCTLRGGATINVRTPTGEFVELSIPLHLTAVLPQGFNACNEKIEVTHARLPKWRDWLSYLWAVEDSERLDQWGQIAAQLAGYVSDDTHRKKLATWIEKTVDGVVEKCTNETAAVLSSLNRDASQAPTLQRITAHNHNAASGAAPDLVVEVVQVGPLRVLRMIGDGGESVVRPELYGCPLGDRLKNDSVSLQQWAWGFRQLLRTWRDPSLESVVVGGTWFANTVSPFRTVCTEDFDKKIQKNCVSVRPISDLDSAWLADGREYRRTVDVELVHADEIVGVGGVQLTAEPSESRTGFEVTAQVLWHPDDVDIDGVAPGEGWRLVFRWMRIQRAAWHQLAAFAEQIGRAESRTRLQSAADFVGDADSAVICRHSAPEALWALVRCRGFLWVLRRRRENNRVVVKTWATRPSEWEIDGASVEVNAAALLAVYSQDGGSPFGGE